MTWSVFLLLLPLVCCYILRNILTCGSCILRWMIWDHMFYVQWLFSLSCLLHQHIMLCRFYMSWCRCSSFAWLLIIYRFSRRDFVPPQNDVCRLLLSLLRMTCDVCCWTSFFCWGSSDFVIARSPKGDVAILKLTGAKFRSLWRILCKIKKNSRLRIL